MNLQVVIAEELQGHIVNNKAKTRTTTKFPKTNLTDIPDRSYMCTDPVERARRHEEYLAAKARLQAYEDMMRAAELERENEARLRAEIVRKERLIKKQEDDLQARVREQHEYELALTKMKCQIEAFNQGLLQPLNENPSPPLAAPASNRINTETTLQMPKPLEAPAKPKPSIKSKSQKAPRKRKGMDLTCK